MKVDKCSCCFSVCVLAVVVRDVAYVMFLLLQFSLTCFLIMRNVVLDMFVCPWHVMFPWHVFDIPYFPYWKLLSALEHSGACVIDALHWAASHGEALVVRDLAYVRNVLAVVVCSWSCMMFLILRNVRRCDRTGSRFCCCSTAWDGHSWHSTPTLGEFNKTRRERNHAHALEAEAEAEASCENASMATFSPNGSVILSYTMMMSFA